LELARLNVAAKMVPSPEWFLYGFVRKEAILTSQIEGTLATLTDLLAYEADAGGAGPEGDVKEVCNYLDALEYASAQMAAPRGVLKETTGRRRDRTFAYSKYLDLISEATELAA